MPDRRLGDLRRKGLGPAGWFPLGLLIGLAGVQNFDLVAFGVLAPDIRHTFHISSGAITAITGLTAALPILVAVFLGQQADRRNRVRLTAASAVLWGVTSVLGGVAPVLSVLIVARLLGGTGLLSAETVYPSLLSDYYPADRMGSVFGSYRFGVQGLALLGGPLAGAIAAVAGWRTAFVLLALPTIALAYVVIRRLEEPPRRGAPESAPAERSSLMEGYRRVRAVPTLRRTWFAAFLFGGGTIPLATLLSNFFKDVYHSSDTTRGLLSGLYGIGGLIGIAIGAYLAHRAIATGRPGRLALVNGLMIIELAVGILAMAAAPDFVLSAIAATILSIGAFGFLPAYTTLVGAVVPSSVRAQAYGWSLFWYAAGGVVVSGVIGAINSAHGSRPALVVLALLVGTGGFVSVDVSRFVKADAERAQQERLEAPSDALLSCRGVSAGYGGVQILFGVDIEVHEGEIIALLGTNGAGKSTLLKAITGLLDPTGGRVSFAGRDLTHADPATCAEVGIASVPGGRGVFPTLSVADNLKVATWSIRRDQAGAAAAIEETLGYFPVLRDRWNTAAGDLSGGEQQMLSLAQAFIARPKLLLVDELSLGLAPTIVNQLLGILRAIHARGTTILVVEQSVTVALELAERAVFMEKGRVRFTGPTAELLERPDILRAVFLQGHNGKRNGKVAAPPSEAVALRVEDVVKTYGGVTAVNSVTFDVHEHEIVGLIGPNGAGKTTLLDLISGFTRLDGGRIWLEGHDVTGLSAPKRAGAGLGRSFQDARLWPNMTVAENLAVALHRDADIESAVPALLGLPSQADSERAIADLVSELIDATHLTAYRNKFVSELSTGTRRMVELACMSAHQPRVLLLDEPSSGIAQKETEALGPVLTELRARLGCAIVVIEHDIALIRSLADRLVALHLGTVIADGRPEDVLRDPSVVESYLGTTVPRPARSRRKVAGASANGYS